VRLTSWIPPWETPLNRDRTASRQRPRVRSIPTAASPDRSLVTANPAGNSQVATTRTPSCCGPAPIATSLLKTTGPSNAGSPVPQESPSSAPKGHGGVRCGDLAGASRSLGPFDDKNVSGKHR
jgi:hypothetical protein